MQTTQRQYCMQTSFLVKQSAVGPTCYAWIPHRLTICTAQCTCRKVRCNNRGCSLQLSFPKGGFCTKAPHCERVEAFQKNSSSLRRPVGRRRKQGQDCQRVGRSQRQSPSAATVEQGDVDVAATYQPIQSVAAALAQATKLASSRHIATRKPRVAAEDLIGWKVFKWPGRSFIGIVEDVFASGEMHASPLLVKVVNSTPEGAQARPGVQEKHLIPFVPEIFCQLDASASKAIIKPPKGLLQLGRQQLLIDFIAPRILELAGANLDNGDELPTLLPMPTRAQLEHLGEQRLVKGILNAGGFMFVAQKLGLRSPRRPNGFWDSIENLDEELSLLVAAHWVELQHPEGSQPYYYNPITGRTQWIEPQPPTRIPLDDNGTVLLAEDERDRLMPSRNDVQAAGRYDLHHAIVYHGGYRAVAEALERRPSWPRNQLSKDKNLLLKELCSIQRQMFGSSSTQMPTASQLQQYGRPDLRLAVIQSGGFHAIAELAGLTTPRNPKGYWADVNNTVAELQNYMQGRNACREPGWFPTSEELNEAGRSDIRCGIRQHGAAYLAGLMGLSVRRAGRRGKRKGTAELLPDQNKGFSALTDLNAGSLCVHKES